MNANNFFNRINSWQRLLIGIAVAVIVFLIVPINDNSLLHLILCWDIFCLIQITLSWITFYTMKHTSIRRQAQKQDDGKVLVFILVLVATVLSMIATILLLTNAESTDVFAIITALSCMIVSWFLVHTIYTTRYAHLYYADDKKNENNPRGGLEFPDKTPHPSFMDFAYFSFTMGMTFQVSDITITSTKLRQVALWHGLISFAFNAIIIALTINTVASLSN